MTRQSAGTTENTSQFHSLSTATSVSSLPGMVHGEERTPLVNQGDVEAGHTTHAQYGSSRSLRTATSGTDETPKDTSKRNSMFMKRVRYYVPSTAWIPDYSASLLSGDLLAGITLAAMLIPQSVSYGTSLAKLSPATGLFAAAIPPIMYSLLGTCRQLNVAPEAALSLLVGQAVSDYRRGDHHTRPEDADAVGIAVSTAITFQVGLFASMLGFFRLGFLDVVLSRALLRGFVTAVAVVITVEQLIPMFGLVALEGEVNPESTLDKIVFLLEFAWSDYHKPTMLVSFGALLVLIIMRTSKGYFRRTWWIERLPEVLIVVVLSTIISGRLRWDEDGVDILGVIPIKTGGHFFSFPLKQSISYIRGTTSTAVLITIMGFLDSTVAAKQNADRFGYSISPNRELVALGAANLVGSFVPGTLPAFGSIVRSKINGDVGARTQLASLVTAGITLLATFFLLPYLYFLPRCVLASIICLFVISLFGEVPHDLMYYWRIRAWTDLAMMFLTFSLSVIWNIEIGIIVSLIISLLLVIKRSSHTRMIILGRIPGTDQWGPIADIPGAEDVPGILIIRIRESLDFANTAQLKERLRRLELYGPERTHPSEEPRRQPASTLVFHMADVETCDASAVQIFHELLETYQNRGVELFVTHLRSGPREMFERAGIEELLGSEAFFATLGEAMTSIGQR
ncbi:sulfate transporter family-domain-containing protein [Suillus clintonianus]|uniref:sulfate transporter family-domain-containing protein n=1 Tax=Suillus clintonianus TaxID=1904413 RepID=UPI001B85DBD7|nr:sulfate transporter family-domain-containing protein [Suillus clintonianus]KAG2122347.1 sulfate transporter family-domain-containing protein [Suillus clintonianus]